MRTDPATRRWNWPWVMAILYLAIAGPATQQLVQHTETQVRLIEAAFNKLTLKNEGSLVVNRIINTQHPFLGPFIIPSVRQALDLPSLQKASREVGVEVPRLIQLAKQERATILLWSWLLVGMSLIYVGATVAMHRGFRARNVIFALTSVSVMFFVVGMSAPALALFTMPTIPLMNAKLTFVLQFEVRSILSVIAGLFSSKHVVLAVVISGFSIVTPLLKTILILIATTSNSAATRKSIVGFVHSIGKWSMADVLVAGVLLAIFALRAEQATKALACLGLYYFVGYCLLSMITTSLLANSDRELAGAVTNQESERGSGIGRRLISTASWSLLGVAVAIALVSGYYAFERRKTPVQKDETATAPLRPVELQSSLINLPAHHWTSVPLSLPYSGILDIKVRVVRGNPVNVALIHADQLPGIEHAKQLIPPAELMKASLGGYRAPSVRSYSHYQAMEAGEYLLIVQDTTLGILAVSSGSIEIRAELWPTDVK